MIKRIPAVIRGPILIALVVAGAVVGIKAAYGGYGHYYDVRMSVPRAGQLLEPGSDVRERGVVIGSVKSIELTGDHVTITLRIDRQYRIPQRAQAYISLKTLLGAKFVDLRSSAFSGPYLADGGRIRASHVGPELEDALQDGVQVLDAIKPDQLATVVSTLAQAASGHGEDIARGLVANADLSGVFSQTLNPQLRSLHDFDVVFGALKDKGVDVNALADAINQGVPVYASAKAQQELDAALKALVPFSSNLADLLILDRHDWDVMMDDGDVVLGAVAARPGGLQDLVLGLYRYMFKLGGAPCTSMCHLNDGSAAAGFTNFIGGDSSAQNQQMICDALPVEVRNTIPFCGGTPTPLPTPTPTLPIP